MYFLKIQNYNSSQSEEKFLTFEKDDNIHIKFINAAANIRSFIFNLPFISEFEAKEIAGNIVPAICSTNSIVAALQVSEALKYLFNKFLESNNSFEDKKLLEFQQPFKEMYVQNNNNKIISMPLQPANP